MILLSRDFKSLVSAYSTTAVYRFLFFKGGTLVPPFLEAPSRFELESEGFADLCLTTWLWCHIGAGDGIRTRDFHLGKVTLYH